MVHVVLENHLLSVWLMAKHYPREFQPDTVFGDSSYPEYARPENGWTFTDRQGNLHDNRDIVPHNPYLSAKYGWF